MRGGAFATTGPSPPALLKTGGGLVSTAGRGSHGLLGAAHVYTSTNGPFFSKSGYFWTNFEKRTSKSASNREFVP